MTYAPAAIIGGLVMFTGIGVGNYSIWKMMDVYEDERRSNSEMFSAVQTISTNERRAAYKAYRETSPNGPYVMTLRIGQGLTVTGILLMFLLLAV